ncbi:hypothetical protein cyc_06913 [Cyclospora cayetanensis]|uniref:Uncharacterized protein n=1 Tax=Cyclospora cayetanensis TaxID=88456 RepID=A0A1D3D7K0_9EIME|nr:hypothetical protein cyc_06913 [Cyclospora cayetanensis]
MELPRMQALDPEGLFGPSQPLSPLNASGSILGIRSAANTKTSSAAGTLAPQRLQAAASHSSFVLPEGWGFPQAPLARRGSASEVHQTLQKELQPSQEQLQQLQQQFALLATKRQEINAMRQQQPLVVHPKTKIQQRQQLQQHMLVQHKLRIHQQMQQHELFHMQQTPQVHLQQHLKPQMHQQQQQPMLQLHQKEPQKVRQQDPCVQVHAKYAQQPRPQAHPPMREHKQQMLPVQQKAMLRLPAQSKMTSTIEGAEKREVAVQKPPSKGSEEGDASQQSQQRSPHQEFPQPATPPPKQQHEHQAKQPPLNMNSLKSTHSQIIQKHARQQLHEQEGMRELCETPQPCLPSSRIRSKADSSSSGAAAASSTTCTDSRSPTESSATNNNNSNPVCTPANTLIILDYDDTLLPTNWVAVQHRVGLGDAVPLALQQELQHLTSRVLQTLSLCLAGGRVVLVTNASAEWVERSGSKFMPVLWQELQKQQIAIFSARDRLQQQGVPQRLWKVRVFTELVTETLGPLVALEGGPCCVVSIGDGEGEREACLELCRSLPGAHWLFKSLKLLGQPTCSQLASQHLLLQQAFRDILLVPQSLDMTVLDYKSDVEGGVEASESLCRMHATNGQQQQQQALPQDSSKQISEGEPSSGHYKHMQGQPLFPPPQDHAAAGETYAETKLLQQKGLRREATDEAVVNTDAFIDRISMELSQQHEQQHDRGTAVEPADSTKLLRMQN